MKHCSKCKKQKSLEEFYYYKNGRPRQACKQCYLDWKSEVGRNKEYRRRYGITVEDYNRIFELQNGSCAICKTHQSKLSCALAVDHCHVTNQVRGLLCFNCNQGLGRFHDSVKKLSTAISYLMNCKDSNIFS